MQKKEDLRVRKTKGNLYRGLLELMETMSFEDIKVTDICRVSMINRSTFYDHFNDKYELLAAFTEDTKQELIEAVELKQEIKNPKDYYIEVVRTLINYIGKEKKVNEVLSMIKKNSNSIAHDMIFDVALTAVSQKLNEQCINNSNIPIETISLFYVSGATNLLMKAVEDPKHFDEKTITYQLDKLIPDLDYLELKEKEGH